MSTRSETNAAEWKRLLVRMLPFADSATKELPLSRLLRLSLFQISTGMAVVLLAGTLNRVMIVELGVPGWLVALMVSLPLVFAPLRALIGFKSDTHVSLLGWRRGPYIFFGTLMQFGGFAILPFALLILSGDGQAPPIVGNIATAFGFLLVGAGMHTTQTAGLALATDLATEESRPRVVALLYVMLLIGMLISSIVFGSLLHDFSAVRLIGVVQGAAMVTIVLNITAMWKQEAQDLALTAPDRDVPDFSMKWQEFIQSGRVMRLLVATALGAAAFSMQDVLLEPYGARVLGMTVSETTSLTALWAAGTLGGFMIAARQLAKTGEPHRLAGFGGVIGIAALAAIILAGAVTSRWLFCIGIFSVGMGGGLFSVGTLIAAMALSRQGEAGLALGVWGAVQATAAGLGIALGGALRDIVAILAEGGHLGQAFIGPVTSYGFVYHLEIGLMFAMLIAIGPLARHASNPELKGSSQFGLTEFPT